MRPPLPLVPVVLAALVAVSSVRADDPSKVDATKRSESFAPPATAVEPEKREMPRAEVLEERRAPTAEKVEKDTAAVAERRAAVDVTESREKTIIEKKARPKPEAPPRDVNRWSGEKARIQPSDTKTKPELVERYQGRMKDATAAASQQKPQLEKRATFSSLNRFIFRRNQSEGDTAVPAGGAPQPSVPRP